MKGSLILILSCCLPLLAVDEGCLRGESSALVQEVNPSSAEASSLRKADYKKELYEAHHTLQESEIDNDMALIQTLDSLHEETSHEETRAKKAGVITPQPSICEAGAIVPKLSLFRITWQEVASAKLIDDSSQEIYLKGYVCERDNHWMLAATPGCSCPKAHLGLKPVVYLDSADVNFLASQPTHQPVSMKGKLEPQNVDGKNQYQLKEAMIIETLDDIEPQSMGQGFAIALIIGTALTTAAIALWQQKP